MDDDLKAKLDGWLEAWKVIGPGMLAYFGDQRAAVLYALSREPYNYDLNDLSRMCGVTRERVRQLISKRAGELARVSRETED
jgi:DNA-directed RNA polymerase sigma subunit (sigma70/sigma32)